MAGEQARSDVNIDSESLKVLPPGRLLVPQTALVTKVFAVRRDGFLRVRTKELLMVITVVAWSKVSARVTAPVGIAVYLPNFPSNHVVATRVFGSFGL